MSLELAGQKDHTPEPDRLSSAEKGSPKAEKDSSRPKMLNEVAQSSSSDWQGALAFNNSGFADFGAFTLGVGSTGGQGRGAFAGTAGVEKDTADAARRTTDQFGRSNQTGRDLAQAGGEQRDDLLIADSSQAAAAQARIEQASTQQLSPESQIRQVAYRTIHPDLLTPEQARALAAGELEPRQARAVERAAIQHVELPGTNKKTASGATVRTGTDGQIDEIRHSNGKVYKVNYREENGQRVVDGYSGLPNGVKDVQFHANGNITYVGSNNKDGEMTIIRGDGTQLKGLSDQPQYQGRWSNFTEFKFDEQGRITSIIPSSEAFWRQGARSREFTWKGDTNELIGTSVISANHRYRAQNGQEYFMVFNHQKQDDGKWTCHDNFGRQWRTPQGEHSLAKNGVYTTPDVRVQGRAFREGVLTSSPGGKDEFKPSAVDSKDGDDDEDEEEQKGRRGRRDRRNKDRTAHNDTNAEGMDSFDERFIYLTNRERAKHGLQPLAFNDKLKDTAIKNSYAMSAHGGNGHFVTQNTYQIAFHGVTDPDAAFRGYMNSSIHRSYLLLPGARYIATGLSTDSNTANII